MRQIFIGGTGRSGTTILKKVLSYHSAILALPVELRVLVDPGGGLDLVHALSDRWSPYKADFALDTFHRMMLACGRSSSAIGVFLEKGEKKLCQKLDVSPRRYLGMGFARFFGASYYHKRLGLLIREISYHVTKGNWIGSPPFRFPHKIFESTPMSRETANSILAEFFDDLYKHAAQQGETPYWVDDTPYNLLHVPELFQMFPQMRFIHIYRDPRDVIASYHKLDWGGDDFVAIARRLEGIYERWFAIRRQLPEECFIEIKLEQLAEYPSQILRSVCCFLELRFENEMLNSSLSSDKVHRGRWREDIPQHLWEKARPYLERFVHSYGYA